MRSRTKFFPQRLQFLQVELILLLVLDLLLDTFEDADSGGIVVYTPRSPHSGLNNCG